MELLSTLGTNPLTDAVLATRRFSSQRIPSARNYLPIYIAGKAAMRAMSAHFLKLVAMMVAGCRFLELELGLS
jgi:hypothetical protein